MSVKSSLLFASRIVFPKSGKKTVGTKSIIGAAVCIALSLIPLVVVISVSDGMIEGITERIINLSSSHIQVEYSFFVDDSIDKTILDEDVKKIKAVPNVKDAYELINSTGLAASTKARCGITIRAVEPEIFRDLDSYKNLFSASSGSIDDFYSSKGRKALIGKGISEKLNIGPGDTIRLVTTNRVNGKITPRITPFKVSAVISSGYQEMDSLWVYIPIEEGQKILKTDSSEVCIMVETKDAFKNLYHIQQRIEHAIDYSANTYRWDELNKDQYENFASTKMLLLFIMLLIVLVASINISSSLVMLTMERRKEIAILKSFGTKNKDISSAFIFTGLAIGLMGVMVGIPLGIIISYNINSIISFFEKIVNIFAELIYFIKNGNVSAFSAIHLMDEAYYLETVPVNIPKSQIMLYTVFTLILSLLASLIPAVKAGKEKPVETLRKAGA
ncbi:ABC transporter permease [Treponema sp.]|uniref:ABC transporter permease n=1 Tax=Treponema sp. TaxID=166 RepID=UPI00298DC7BC|nr:ABC transporter permease [Treponema sp.]MCR5614430.1 FtsX-like permease family protein [Treponema sp.]